ncbi:MAG: HAMP domain-containing sensor histidine kinase [Hyphomicrobiaceae bacterium]|nr:HAMP domain-containing sensor histidine kinase [Hyphomicrobiaceae bacterium]
MLRTINPFRWPLAWRVPLLVVLLMLSVSVVITDRVLTRLADSQTRHLAQLSDAYLDGLSSGILPHVVREDVWEIYDALDRARQRYQGLDIAWTVVSDSQGRVLASSHPREFPLQSHLSDRIKLGDSADPKPAMTEALGRAHLRRDLTYQGRTLGVVHAEVRIEGLIRERWEVLRTLVMTNALLTLTLAAIGYVAVLRMMRPVRVLSAHLRSGAEGRMSSIRESELGPPNSEFGQLFRSYNTLLGSVSERERLLAKLAEEERLAALGRLAAGMAHDINNPLGGLLNAVATLKRHGEKPAARETSIRLLETGLRGIRDIVRSSLATYRRRDDQLPLTCGDLDDLQLLLQPEIKRKRLSLQWDNRIDRPLAVPAGAVRDAALNLLLNGCAASPIAGTLTFDAYATKAGLVLEVGDEGPGMPEVVLRYVNEQDDGQAPLSEREGLGLWMVKRLSRESGGCLSARRKSSGGTAVQLVVPEAATAPQSVQQPREERRHVA